MLRDRFRWAIVFLLFAITVVDYIDRSAIAFAVPEIEQELGLSASAIGLILGAFGLGYAATTFLGGLAVDRVGAKAVLTGAVLLWVLAIGATGLATGFAMLYVARVALGVAEGPSFPAVTVAVRRWLPARERASALSGALVAVPLALALGAPAISQLIDAIGWRAMFLSLAVLSFAWLPLWLWLYRDDPARSRHVTPKELDHIRHGEAPETRGEQGNGRPWHRLIATPTLLVNYWAFFVFGYFLFFFMSWLPGYLNKTYGLEIVTAGWLAALPWLAAVVAMLIFGGWSDRVLRRGSSLRQARSLQIAGTQLIAALAVIPVALVDSLTVAMIGITFAVAATMAANAAYFAVNIDVLPRWSGTALGIMDCCFAVAAFLAPVVTGFVFDASGSFSSAFLLMAVLAGSSVILVLLFHHPDRDRDRLAASGLSSAG